MTQLAPVVFLLDVDNNLLDNDRITADLKTHLTQAFGAERQERYWAIFEKLRLELGYADYCDEVLAKFVKAGIDTDVLAAQLQDEGAKAFVKSWNELLASIGSKGETLKKAG